MFKCVHTCSNLFKTCSNVFKLSQMRSNLFKTCSNVFKCVQMCSNVFKLDQTCSKSVQNLFKCVQTCSKLFKTCSNVFKCVQTPSKPLKECSMFILGCFKCDTSIKTSHPTSPLEILPPGVLIKTALEPLHGKNYTQYLK